MFLCHKHCKFPTHVVFVFTVKFDLKCMFGYLIFQIFRGVGEHAPRPPRKAHALHFAVPSSTFVPYSLNWMHAPYHKPSQIYMLAQL